MTKMSNSDPLFPYYGTAHVEAPLTASLILNLQNRGPKVSRLNPSFYALDGPDTSLYYAYPVSYGASVFRNLNTREAVRWDGAHRDSGLTRGPAILDIMIGHINVPFYVYQATRTNMSPPRETIFWEVE